MLKHIFSHFYFLVAHWGQMISSHDTLWIVDEKKEDDTKKGAKKRTFRCHGKQQWKRKRKKNFYIKCLTILARQWRILSLSISFHPQKRWIFLRIYASLDVSMVYLQFVYYVFGEGREKKHKKRWLGIHYYPLHFFLF